MDNIKVKPVMTRRNQLTMDIFKEIEKKGQDSVYRGAQTYHRREGSLSNPSAVPSKDVIWSRGYAWLG